MAASFIELKDLSKSYLSRAGNQEVLTDLNLSINEGEFVALMGPSGSGKSTLMNIIGCLDLPTSGIYLLNGTDVGSLDYDEQAILRNNTIGFIFQGFNLLPRATLEKNVMLPLVYARVGKEERHDRARVLLEKVGLGNRLLAMPNEISGGEQQRVAIARALANNPKLILADEPTGNLDSGSGRVIMDIFTELNKEGITIFLVTHELNIASYAKRQIKLLDGKIVQDEATKGANQ
ncbi:MAG: ABC transporter ATP-binding protein [Gammaproteobacteria bacterium]|nr:ABC transporter ATP-binding protein [Gammaproteobacteria bacterium]